MVAGADDLDGNFYEVALRRIVAGVLAQAIEDCQSADELKAEGARVWLADLGADLAQALGWPRESVLTWLATLPELAQLAFKFD